ncbi:MAG: ABC transporter permease subunit [Firmicutes bacterium]|jgi:multiple sugar transport system permease protein|nr:ABC transporter permease subunit [Bacillota bacterium]
MKTSYKLYFFLIPVLAYQLIFGIYPLFYNFILSFKDVNLITYIRGTSQWIGLSNYTQTLGNTVFQRTFFNTLVFVGLSLLFQFIIGFSLAILFNRSFPLKGLLQSLIMVPWVLPIIVSGSFFRWFFSDRGMANGFFLSWGLIDKPIPWITSQTLPIFSITMANIWLGIPFNFVLLYTGLAAIPLQLFESADIDGANWWQKIIFIAIPILKPVIIVTLTLGCIFTVKVFDLVWIITQGGPGEVSHLLSTLSYSLAFNKFQFGKASSVLVIMLLLTIGLTIFLNSIRAKEEK